MHGFRLIIRIGPHRSKILGQPLSKSRGDKKPNRFQEGACSVNGRDYIGLGSHRGRDSPFRSTLLCPEIWGLWVLMFSLSVLQPPALPTLFTKELRNEEATESGTATLRCELSKATPVEWMKDQKALKSSDKYKMRQKDVTAELTIHDLEEHDSGDYTCICGNQKTTASLTVHGNRDFLWAHPCLQVDALDIICKDIFLWQLSIYIPEIS